VIVVDPKFTLGFCAVRADRDDTKTKPEFRNAMSREDYEKMGAMIKTYLGKLQSKTRGQFSVRQMNATTLAYVAYSAKFEKGQATLQVRLKKVGGQWQLVSFHITSPQFQKDLATQSCPHCGKPHAESAAFCPHCGKPIEETVGSE